MFMSLTLAHTTEEGQIGGRGRKSQVNCAFFNTTQKAYKNAWLFTKTKKQEHEAKEGNWKGRAPLLAYHNEWGSHHSCHHSHYLHHTDKFVECICLCSDIL